MATPTLNPVPDDEDPGAARIVDLAQRRADRAAAEQGLAPAADGDRETVTIQRDEPGVPVDPPEPPVDVAGLLDERPEPVLPAWVRDGYQRKTALKRAVRAAGYHVGRHGVRLPWYAVKVGWYAPRGAVRLVAMATGWASAERGNFGLRQHAADRNDAKTWLDLDRHRQRQAAWRWWVVVAGLLAAVDAVLVLATGLLPWWVRLPAIVAALMVAARYGRPVGKPILARTLVHDRYRRLTAELTRKGIMATGLVKKPEDVTFPRDIRTDGPGHLALVDLPDGVIAADVVDKRDQLAGGMRLPVDQVWPETVRGEHPGRLALWVAERPVSAMKHPAWPLLRTGTADYFKDIPYGFDVRLRPVSWKLAERNSLFGGVPGSGKSLAVRNVALGAVLDPLVIPLVSELKGSGDYEMFEPLCPDGMYISGTTDAENKATLRMIEWIYQQCDIRAPLVAKYAAQGLNSVKKVNRAMALRDERLRPILAIFDEIQEFMSSPLGIKGDGAPLLMSAIKRARALGIHIIVATQRFDKDSMPKAISSLVVNRACLAVPAQPETDMVLGTSAYRTGARPTQFIPEDDAGWMVRAGFRAGFETIRATYLDDDAARKVCKRALSQREGQATNVVQLPPERNLIADVLAVIEPGREGIHREPTANALAARWPEVYARWTADMISARLADDGVRTVTVNIGGDRQRGWRREHLAKSLDAPSHK